MFGFKDSDESSSLQAKASSADDLSCDDRIFQGKFKAILNKVTPYNFENFIKRIDGLPIDSMERLKKTVCLIFEQALNEPLYYREYARICKHLRFNYLIKKSELQGTKASNEFCRMLLIRSQEKFYQDLYESVDIEGKMNEINKISDYTGRRVAEEKLQEEKRQTKHRWLRLIRFIGELYMVDILSWTVIECMLLHLLNRYCDEYFEATCVLLKSINPKFEDFMQKAEQTLSSCGQSPRLIMNELFGKLEKIVETKPNYISTRVRFLILDLIEMRQRGWRLRWLEFINQPQPMLEELENINFVSTSPKNKKNRQRNVPS